ncbi:MAG: hypothetical protein EOO20_27840 [Chryseobacterium sp.]|nr:MAG: hypothetical protein EOO20_27840 [Chryseobacterium sp.]
MKRTKAILILSNLTAGLLVVSFSIGIVSKILAFKEFEYNLGATLFVKDYAEFLSYILLLIYFSALVLLCIKPLQKVGFYFSFALLSSYAIYIAVLLSVSKSMPCTCISILDKLTWKQNLNYSIVMLILIATTVLIQILKKKYK